MLIIINSRKKTIFIFFLPSFLQSRKSTMCCPCSVGSLFFSYSNSFLGAKGGWISYVCLLGRRPCQKQQQRRSG